MDQITAFLLPCPQRGSGLFSSSDQCFRVQDLLSPTAVWTGEFLTKSPPQGGRRMQDRELVMSLKDGYP